MVTSGAGGRQKAARMDSGMGQVPVEHYLRILMHRKWLAAGVWVAVSVATVTVAYRLPNTYTSETVILVDPQKVPEAYVKPTVSGDVRNRLGTLSQQILSESRLQKIIDANNLYQEEKKKGLFREDIITLMRSDISVKVVSDFGASQDLQAFRISYSGRDPQLVAAVTNQIAEQFITQNLEDRAEQANGTANFLTNQLAETRKKLEEQEARLRDFRLKHVGEMPKQETAELQLLGQAQSQLQMESDSLSRAEQQRSYIQSMMAQTAPVVDLDASENVGTKAAPDSRATALAAAKAKLAQLLTRYTEDHPDVRKLKKAIADEEAKQAAAKQQAAASEPAPAPKPAPKPPADHYNPVLQAQLTTLDAEIAKHKQEQERLSKLVAVYRAKLDAIPVREQEIAQLERDYEMSKAHYSQLLEKQLSAQTASELEVRQKGEKFKPLDRALPAERPSSPNRLLINLAGSFGGLIFGLLLATANEFFAPSIVEAQDLAEATGLALLGEIPVIRTQADRRLRKMWILVATTSMVVAALAGGAVLIYHYRGPI